MKKMLFALVLAVLLPIGLLAGSGDVNGDGKINVADIVQIISYLQGDQPEEFNLDEADVNNDGNIDVNDLTAIEKRILKSPYIRVEKNEYHLINQSGNYFYVKYTTNNNNHAFEILGGSDSNWLRMTFDTGYNEGQTEACIAGFQYDNNFTGQERIALIGVKNSEGNYVETIRVVHHPAKLANLSSWDHRFAVCQPTGDILEIPIWGNDSLEVELYDPTDEFSTDRSGNDIPSYMHRLSDEIIDGNRIVRIQIDPNESDEERYYVLCVKVGDAEADRFRFLQPWKGAPSFAEQVEALKEFYTLKDGEHWNYRDNWMSDKPINEWFGVNNYAFGDTIIGNYILFLNLESNEIKGKIPESFAKLMPYSKKYGNVGIQGNLLSGKIPDVVKNHPRWHDLGWNIISQYEIRPNKTLFDYDDFNLKTTDKEFTNIVDDSKSTVHSILKQNKLTLVCNAGLITPDWFIGISDDRINMYLDYCNKGFGMVCNVGSFWDYTYDYCKEYIADKLNQGMPSGIIWTTPSFGDHQGPQGSLALYDSDGNLIQFYGTVSEGGVFPEYWYNEQVDSVLRARLGEPDSHEIYYSSDYASTDFSRDGEVVVLQEAKVGNGVNLVFIGEAFIDKDMIPGGKYEKKMKEAMEQFFSEEPYTSLRDRFNVYAVKAVSKNVVKLYGSTEETQHAINRSDTKAFEYAAKALGDDAKNMMVNVIYNEGVVFDTSYTNMFMEDGSYVSYVFEGSGAFEGNGGGRVINHEGGGHGVAFLADEYVLGGNEDAEFDEGGKRILDNWWSSYGYGANVDYHSNPSEVKWAHFINDERYADEHIGVYEGAHLAGKGCFRPTENSMMRYNDCGFNAPSREAIYKRVMKLSEGDDWEYDYETFVAFDAPAREAYKAALSRSESRGTSAQQRRIESRPPTIYKGTWRDAGKCEKVEYSVKSK